MARRGAKPSAPLQPRPSQKSDSKRAPARWSTDSDDLDRRQEAAETSERVRRIALGLTAALVTARAFWPSEPDLREGAGSGLYWVFVVFIVVRAGADRRAGRRPLSLPLVVDRCPGRRSHVAGRGERIACA